MNDAIDLQVNGYAGVDFNADRVDVDSMRGACLALRQHGVQHILATLITDSIDRLTERLANLTRLREQDSLVREVVLGFHLEGPFLNPEPGYIGAHPTAHAVPANLDAMQRLIEAAGGLTRVVTLAPECDPNLAVTRWLVDQGITVAAGHCNPTAEQLNAAVDAGLSMFTHLGNGCPLQLHRHDNIIQRVLALSDRIYVGFIADGIHVPFAALKNYLRLVGLERAFVVTDAISAAGMGPGEYDLCGQRVVVDEHLATWAADKSHLVGSAMTMPRVKQNLREQLGFDQPTVERLTRANPMSAIGP